MKWRVTAAESGWTLLHFLRHHLPDYSAKSLKRALEEQNCRVNGRLERFSSTVLGTGDEIHLNLIQKTKADNRPKILYEDDHLTIIDKPAGITVETLAKAHEDLILVHRLDKPTSGVLIFAKNRDTFDRMVELFRQKLIEKHYLALVSGKVVTSEGKVENYLGKIHPIGGQAIWGALDAGQYALTFWKLLQKGKKGTLVEAKPITGRTHQIRTHLASVGMPIVGDAQYSPRGRYVEAPRVMLHAYRIRFPHPGTNQFVDVKAGLPEDFINQMQLMGISWENVI
jgi:23S rRNA pseudouridine955/2504/2580 synthase/23S rRNA pseudouridine1911/1915/1917 synthase